jgi:hypothetical protein
MFWDSSALVPLLVAERRSAELTSVLTSDREVTVWWATPVECLSAIYRFHRDQPLSQTALALAIERMRALVEDADTVAPTDQVRRRAGRIVATHSLRAADALQLAAALVWCEEQPSGETVVSLDDRLRGAASREGFSVLPA